MKPSKFLMVFLLMPFPTTPSLLCKIHPFREGELLFSNANR